MRFVTKVLLCVYRQIRSPIVIFKSSFKLQIRWFRIFQIMNSVTHFEKHNTLHAGLYETNYHCISEPPRQ